MGHQVNRVMYFVENGKMVYFLNLVNKLAILCHCWIIQQLMVLDLILTLVIIEIFNLILTRDFSFHRRLMHIIRFQAFVDIWIFKCWQTLISRPMIMYECAKWLGCRKAISWTKTGKHLYLDTILWENSI